MNRFQEVKRVLAVLDLAGFTRVMSELDALAVAAFLDDHCAFVAERITAFGGRIVKLMGDGVFAVFAEEDAARAVVCVVSLVETHAGRAPSKRLGTVLGANVHLATVAEGEFAVDGRYDVVGAGVNHLFRMGGAAGVRISEPVFRQLPNDVRSVWKKNKPPATYRFDPRG